MIGPGPYRQPHYNSSTGGTSEHQQQHHRTHDGDMAAVRQFVDRAVRAAVPASQMTTCKIRPESDYGFPEPRPLAGLQD
ncbi:hypothetical protein JNW90_01180 [Micromonospora sp. STR1s_5]|nr:hypothetical protein [Micromonospora sp. STR1s_5]